MILETLNRLTCISPNLTTLSTLLLEKRACGVPVWYGHGIRPVQGGAASAKKIVARSLYYVKPQISLAWDPQIF